MRLFFYILASVSICLQNTVTKRLEHVEKLFVFQIIRISQTLHLGHQTSFCHLASLIISILLSVCFIHNAGLQSSLEYFSFCLISEEEAGRLSDSRVISRALVTCAGTWQIELFYLFSELCLVFICLFASPSRSLQW